MRTATISRDYLSKIFATMNPSDTTWAIKTLTERLYLFGQAASAEVSTHQTKAESLTAIDHAFAQLKDIQDGKMEGIPAESIINEL